MIHLEAYSTEEQAREGVSLDHQQEKIAQLGDTVETIVRVYVKPTTPSQESIDAAPQTLE
jgi:hypothetical protein